MHQGRTLFIVSDFPHSHDTQRYVDVARRFGVSVRQIPHVESMVISTGDAAIVRGSPRHSSAVLATLQHIEAVRAACLTTAAGWTASKDRIVMYENLLADDVATPYTARTVEEYLATHAIPAVIKVTNSNQGRGVAVADSTRSLTSFCDVLTTTGAEYVIQEFLPSARAQDDRYIVVGDRVVAAMRRTAKMGDFRSNLSLGGVAEAIEIEATTADLAVRAARALNLQLAGIDIMTMSTGSRVLEVNSSPGLGIEEVTGINVAHEVVRQVLAQ